MTKPTYMREQWDQLVPFMENGPIKPPVGATYAFEEFGQALADMDAGSTLGKSLVVVR